MFMISDLKKPKNYNSNNSLPVAPILFDDDLVERYPIYMGISIRDPYMKFLTLSDKAKEYYLQLGQRRLNSFLHIRKIVALSEIYPKEQVALAIEDAIKFDAFSSEYITNILEQRLRPTEEPGALHVTRSSDLLDLTIDPPDLSIYNIGDKND